MLSGVFLYKYICSVFHWAWSLASPPCSLTHNFSKFLGLKGVSAKVIILEEASRLDQAVFYEVVVPLLGVSNTAVLGISTPLGEDNYYSQLSSLLDENDRPLFKTMTINLVCDVCRRADSSMLQCVHRLSQLPAWKSQANQEKVKRIMSSVPELFAREALGVITSERFGVFSAAQAKSILSLPVAAPSSHLPIFTVIDPTGGGDSKLAMVTLGITEKKHLTIVSNQP